MALIFFEFCYRFGFKTMTGKVYARGIGVIPRRSLGVIYENHTVGIEEHKFKENHHNPNSCKMTLLMFLEP